jgi:hypothetical protein
MESAASSAGWISYEIRALRMWQPLMGLDISNLALSGLFANIFIDSNGVAHAYAQLVTTSKGRVINPRTYRKARDRPLDQLLSVSKRVFCSIIPYLVKGI